MNNPFYEAISTPLRSHRRPPVSERGRGSEEVREVEREKGEKDKTRVDKRGRENAEEEGESERKE